MAVISILEAQGLTTAQGQVPYHVPVMSLRNPTEQEITALSATPQQSSAFQSDTSVVYICADVAIRFRVGTNPTAAATSTRLPADVVYVFGVPSGQSYKISVRTA